MSNRALALRQVAVKQGGCFTASQARSLGYVRQDQFYHVRAGNWTRLGWGLYRLPGYTNGMESGFIRWCLWSRNQNGQPQAVISHESALEYHRLSGRPGVPSVKAGPGPSKVHLTVPPVFRKVLPEEIRIHRDRLLAEEIEDHGAFRVTTLDRTLRDLRLQGQAPEPTEANETERQRRCWQVTGLKRIVIYAALYTDQERRMWKAVLDSYLDHSPFVEIETCFDGRNDAAALQADLCFSSPIFFAKNRTQWAELDRHLCRSGMLDEKGFCAGILEVGKADGHLYSLPVLRNTPVILANPQVLAQYGVTLDEVRRPVDVFRLGAQIEAKSRGLVKGCGFWALTQHASPYGVDFKRAGDRAIFDEENMRAFLLTTKPFIKLRQLTDMHRDQTPLFVAGSLAFHHTFLYAWEELKARAAGISAQLVPRALAKGGFVCESMFMGQINRSSRFQEDAFELLAYTVSADAQRIFIRHSPCWLSVHREVLQKQRADSPFPRNTVRHEFDPRNYQVQVDPVLFEAYCAKLNSEAARFFLDRQSLDQTLENLRKV